jgi:hypothetical protein
VADFERLVLGGVHVLVGHLVGVLGVTATVVVAANTTCDADNAGCAGRLNHPPTRDRLL